MAEYNFAPDEYVVLRADDVSKVGKKSLSMSTHSELMLTNLNIVYPIKGMFGKTKGFEVFPLSDIRIVDGVPQCRLDTSTFMEARLEISFQYQLVSFSFNSLENKKEIREWVNAISNLLVGEDAEETQTRAGGVGALTDSEEIANAFGNIFGAFENARAKKRAKRAPEVAYRCPSCNASIKGKLGSTVTCPYCNSHVTITDGEPV